MPAGTAQKLRRRRDIGSTGNAIVELTDINPYQPVTFTPKRPLPCAASPFPIAHWTVCWMPSLGRPLLSRAVHHLAEHASVRVHAEGARVAHELQDADLELAAGPFVAILGIQQRVLCFHRVAGKIG